MPSAVVSFQPRFFNTLHMQLFSLFFMMEAVMKLDPALTQKLLFIGCLLVKVENYGVHMETGSVEKTRETGVQVGLILAFYRPC